MHNNMVPGVGLQGDAEASLGFPASVMGLGGPGKIGASEKAQEQWVQ